MKTLAAEQYKNSELFDTLKEQIETSVLKAGDRLPGERRLSELYDCSRSTVRSSLKKLEDLRLVERVRGSGTYVSMRLKKKQARKNIAIIVQTGKGESDLGNDPYLSQILVGLQRYYGNKRCNFNLLIMGLEENLESFFKKSDFSIDDFDGYICFLYGLDDEDVFFLRKSSVPFVTTGPSAGYENVSYVAIDNAAGVYAATNHLLSLGRKRVRLLNGPLIYEVNRERLAGFEKALIEHDIEFDNSMNIEIVPSDHNLSYEVVKEMCINRESDDFDGLVIYGDWGTYGAFQAIKKNGLKVPEDVAIVMYDDIPWVQKILEPPITAVKQPFMDQAKRMLRILVNQIDDKDEAVIIEILQPQLTVRESCGSSLLQE